MNADGAMVLIDTSLGTILLPIEVVLKARRDADDLLGDVERSETPRPPPTRLLDASGLSELFAMDATWFLARARENRIPHVRIGKYVRFDPEEIRYFFHHEPDRHEDL